MAMGTFFMIAPLVFDMVVEGHYSDKVHRPFRRL
jgi:hypothetical protein